MDWFFKIKNAFRLSTFVIALAALLTGTLVLYGFAVCPAENAKNSAKQKIDQLTDTYIQLKSHDITAIAEQLNHEVSYLREKDQRIFSHIYKLEEIPVLVANIEKSADNSGLIANMQLIRENEHPGQQITERTLNIVFSGSLKQIIQFLNNLNKQPGTFLLSSFKLVNQDGKQEQLSGHLQILILTEK